MSFGKNSRNISWHYIGIKTIVGTVIARLTVGGLRTRAQCVGGLRGSRAEYGWGALPY